MVRIWQGVLNWRRIYQLPKTKLPHNPLLRHLLHEDIEDDLRFCHPIRSVTCTKIRNTSGVSSLDDLLRVRLPDHRSVHIKLLVKCNVALLRLVSSKVSLRTTQVIFNHGRNNMFVNVLNYNQNTYPVACIHGRNSRLVDVVTVKDLPQWERLFRYGWPSYREPLPRPELQK